MPPLHVPPDAITRATLTVRDVDCGVAPCVDKPITPERAGELLSQLSGDPIEPGCIVGGGWRAAVTLQLTLRDGTDDRISLDSALRYWCSRLADPGDHPVLPGFAAALARAVDVA